MSSEMWWVPLEINPSVMNTWANKGGLATTDYEFRDIYSLDPDLLTIVPRPIKAVILLFPWTPVYRRRQAAHAARIARDGQYPIDPDVIWIEQTIRNACGSMALLHALANAGLPIEFDSPLGRFFAQCKGKTGTERAALLEASADIAAVHAETAAMGQTAAPEAYVHGIPHYTCFVQAPSDKAGEYRLVELDGEKGGPVDRGVCDDLLESAARVIQEKYIAKEKGRNEFGIVVLAPVVRE